MIRILVTNDDGIASAGLQSLAQALAPLGEVTVVAPAKEQSAVGHGITVRRALELRPDRNGWYSVDGTPTDCVNVAVTEVLGRVPDLVVSGINEGLNLGDDVTYSGTVAGALEGVLLGVPALAVSLQRSPTPMDYTQAGRVAKQLAASILERGLPHRTLLNVNVPSREARGCRVTVQAGRSQSFGMVGTPTGDERSAVRFDSIELAWEPHERSDYEAVQAGWVSITPLQTDWTHHAAIEAVERLTLSTPAEVE